MKVAIGVLTYKRPDGLKRLLAGLELLTFDKVSTPEVHVLVIDNDPEASAQDYCIQRQGSYRWRLRYSHEPRRGISHARNRALDLSAEGYDGIAFIDDDEEPAPDWLDQLLFVQQEYGADVVTGPVLPRMEEPAPAWSKKGRFYERSRHPTGFRMELARTGNVLIRTSLLEDPANRFDPRYGLSGGEDTHFFLRVRQQGHEIIWADEAVVYEWVPASRIKPGWLLQRAYRSGNTYALCERDIRLPVHRLLLRAVKGVMRIGWGMLLLLPSVLLGPVRLIRSLQQICIGAGMVMGLAGSRYEEYEETHGV
ncbi:MAG TPA: glycosyltransferase family A protein [Brevibacillus sp.]|nr:glycosyltransferase family A protein [Brevibacillus sp.]